MFRKCKMKMNDKQTLFSGGQKAVAGNRILKNSLRLSPDVFKDTV